MLKIPTIPHMVVKAVKFVNVYVETPKSNSHRSADTLGGVFFN